MPLFLWLPYVVVIIAATTVDLAGYPNAAWFVGTLGTVVVLLGLTVYAAIDSRQRWPGLSLSQRLGRIFTFQR
jgi:hypothetical protein